MVDPISARTLGPGNRPSVLAGFRVSAGVGAGQAVLVLAVHAVLGEDQDDAYLAGSLRGLLDSGAAALNAATPPAEVLRSLHASALPTGRYYSGAVARVDGDTVTVARTGLAQVTTFEPGPTVRLAAEVLHPEADPPVLTAALGAPRPPTPQELLLRTPHALILVGGTVAPDAVPGLPAAAHDPTGRGGIAVELRGLPRQE
jgi:hypothetical protein